MEKTTPNSSCDDCPMKNPHQDGPDLAKRSVIEFSRRLQALEDRVIDQGETSMSIEDIERMIGG